MTQEAGGTPPTRSAPAHVQSVQRIDSPAELAMAEALKSAGAGYQTREQNAVALSEQRTARLGLLLDQEDRQAKRELLVTVLLATLAASVVAAALAYQRWEVVTHTAALLFGLLADRLGGRAGRPASPPARSPAE